MGNFLDDLQVRIDQAKEQLGTDINQYLQKTASDALVKIGLPPKGNLTEEQIKAGEKGSAPPISESNMMASQPAQVVGLSLTGMVLLGGLAYFLFFSKKSRG